MTDTALLERALATLDNKFDSDSVAAVEAILREHFAGLNVEQGAVNVAERGVGLVLLDGDRLVTVDVSIPADARPTVTMEVRALDDAVVSLNTRPGARQPAGFELEREWLFKFPDGTVTRLVGWVNAHGAPDDTEQLARAVASRVGRTRPVPSEGRGR